MESAQHPFDKAVSLEKVGDGRYYGHTSDDYWNMVGPFGGVTAAVLLRSVMDHSSRQGQPVLLHIHYCAPVARGPFEIVPEVKRTSRSTQHWTMTLRQSGEIAAFGSVMVGARPETFETIQTVLPVVPPFDELPRYRTSGFAWAERFDFRFAEGAIRLSSEAEVPGETRSVLRVSHQPARPMDFPGLAALCDIFFARIVHLRRRLVPFGTVAMTVNFHATEDDLLRHGSSPILGVVDSKIFRQGYHDQSAEIWSSDGQLLATTNQIIYFRD